MPSPRSDEAVALDGRYAAAHYHRGRALYELGKYEDAKQALVRALVEDVCPLRALPEMRDIINEVATENNVPLVDFHQLTAQQAEHGIPGADEFLDHVHPTLKGHRLLALALLDALQRQGLVTVDDSWGEEALTQVADRIDQRLDEKAHGDALRNLARLSSWLGRFDEASRTMAKAMELLGEDAATMDLMGQNAAARDQREEAIALYRRSVEINPDYADAHLHLGTELVNRGSIPEGLPTSTGPLPWTRSPPRRTSSSGSLSPARATMIRRYGSTAGRSRCGRAPPSLITIWGLTWPAGVIRSRASVTFGRLWKSTQTM